MKSMLREIVVRFIDEQSQLTSNAYSIERMSITEYGSVLLLNREIQVSEGQGSMCTIQLELGNESRNTFQVYALDIC